MTFHFYVSSAAMQTPAAASLDGSTRLHFIVGDPIAQVKSPAGVTQALRGLGY